MPLRSPQPIWLAAILIGLAVGIWPGIAMGQHHWAWMGVLLGWMTFPNVLIGIIGGWMSWSSLFEPATVTSYGYLVAVIGYAICAYLALRRLRNVRLALELTVVAVACSAIVSIPEAIIAMGLGQNMPLGPFAIGYLSTWGTWALHGIIAFHLTISAVLGWWLARTVLRLQQRMAPASAGSMDVSRETSTE